MLKAGVEGLMLRCADALYEAGCSDTLLKLKPWLDAEAVVVGHRPGEGKYAGQLGASSAWGQGSPTNSPASYLARFDSIMWRRDE